MNYKIMTIIFAVCIGLSGCTQPKNEHDYQQNLVSNNKITDPVDSQIHRVLEKLNKEFAEYERTNPQQGYCVTIDTDTGDTGLGDTTQGLRAKITPYGGPRASKLLSGMPADVASYRNQCAFCYYQSHQSDPHFIKDFCDQSYAVTSLNHQILVIPQEHYPHLFATPLEMQKTIIKNMLAIRSQHSAKIRRPMEFHCGSAAGQTVFHLHGRTGVYV